MDCPSADISPMSFGRHSRRADRPCRSMRTRMPIISWPIGDESVGELRRNGAAGQMTPWAASGLLWSFCWPSRLLTAYRCKLCHWHLLHLLFRFCFRLFHDFDETFSCLYFYVLPLWLPAHLHPFAFGCHPLGLAMPTKCAAMGRKRTQRQHQVQLLR